VYCVVISIDGESIVVGYSTVFQTFHEFKNYKSVLLNLQQKIISKYKKKCIIEFKTKIIWRYKKCIIEFTAKII
jgi:hypothetical protein